MKALIIILAMTTKVNAWKSMYGIMADYTEDTYTDSDGIEYRRDGRQSMYYEDPIDIDDVPEPDRHLYQKLFATNTTTAPIIFQIPLTDDGFYILIAKFVHGDEGKGDVMNMTFNTHIPLLTNIDMEDLVSGTFKSTDKYFYFCVSDGKVYYKNQVFLIEGGKIQLSIKAVNGSAYISSLALLSGTIGEEDTLKSSNTKEKLHFDPFKMNFKCLNEASLLSEIRNHTNAALQSLQSEQDEHLKLLQNSIDVFSGSSLSQISALSEVLQTTQKEINNSSANTELAIKRLQIEHHATLTYIQNTCDSILTTIQHGMHVCQQEQYENFGRHQDMYKNATKINQQIVSRMDNLEAETIKSTKVIMGAQSEQYKNINQLRSSIDLLSNNSLVNISNLNAAIQIAIEAAHKDLKAEQSENFKQLQTTYYDVQQTNKIYENTIRRDQQMGMRMEKLEAESRKANKAISEMAQQLEEIRKLLIEHTVNSKITIVTSEF